MLQSVGRKRLTRKKYHALFNVGRYHHTNNLCRHSSPCRCGPQYRSDGGSMRSPCSAQAKRARNDLPPAVHTGVHGRKGRRADGHDLRRMRTPRRGKRIRSRRTRTHWSPAIHDPVHGGKNTATRSPVPLVICCRRGVANTVTRASAECRMRTNILFARISDCTVPVACLEESQLRGATQ
jgi:hypothetical protein